MSRLACLLSACILVIHAHAQITVYGTQGVLSIVPGLNASATVRTDPTSVYDPYPPTYTGYGAFNPIVLAPPALPSPPPPTQFTITVPNGAQNMPGLSIAHGGDFLGFSIEMSIVTSVVGLNGSFIQPAFLNLMALLAERGGRVNCRFGGNTQEQAVVVDSLSNGKAMQKFQSTQTSDRESTPILYFTPEIIYLLNNVSSLVDVKWFVGIPFNDTSNPRLAIAELAEAILGDNLLGLQLGNEPDLYAAHNHRPATYSPSDYFNEVGVMIGDIAADSNIPIRNNLVVPSVSGTWSPELIWNTGLITAYSDEIGALAVEYYPENNCAAEFPDGGFGQITDPQTMFPGYLNHTSSQSIVAPYLDSTNIAQAAGKPFYMFETNTASCGGFPGLSDSFGSALWMVDYALQMAYGNFSMALMHVGGVDETYNPFLPPPGKMASVDQWTVGAIFYASLVVSEALGRSGAAQVVDLLPNSGDIYSPGYAIYENGALARMVLINFLTDSTGASDYTASISVGGGQTGEGNGTPPTVNVKYLRAQSVASKYNITWAGQTLGEQGQADGRLVGDETVQTVQCDQTANTCAISVPAPGVALIFFTDDAMSDSTPTSTQTFATTAVTQLLNTASVAPNVLETSNGHNAGDRSGSHMGSTSHRKVSVAEPARILYGTMELWMMTMSVVVLTRFL